MTEIRTLDDVGKDLEGFFSQHNIKTKYLNAILAPQEKRFNFDGGAYTTSQLKRAMDILLNMQGFTYERNGDGGFTVKLKREHRQFVGCGNCSESIENAIAHDTDGNGKQKGYICFGLSETDYLTTNLDDCAHILVAGSTGSGKSCLLNSLIIQLLVYSNADLILIDPKQGAEFGVYEEDIHSRIKAVAKNTKTALEWLETMVYRMESRYREMDLTKDKKYHGNKIVIVIDELAELMMTSKQQAEDYIVRLAQKGRAAGIHLIVATQDPRVAVVTGLIKNNLPTVVCLKTRNARHSMNVIDIGAGANLLGKGDSYIKLATSTELYRVQTPYITDDNIMKLLTT
jgi:DNA segregation ATPase FtsK/SpoIIIE-like protein